MRFLIAAAFVLMALARPAYAAETNASIRAVGDKVGKSCDEKGWSRSGGECAALSMQYGQVLCDQSENLRALYPDGECAERLGARIKASIPAPV